MAQRDEGEAAAALQQKEPEDLDVLAEEEEITNRPGHGENSTQGCRRRWTSSRHDRHHEEILDGDGRELRNATCGDGDCWTAQESQSASGCIQEKYIALIEGASQTNLLTYEALIMKEYWICYRVAVKAGQQWFGPRKKSRFVREFVDDPAGRARGYSAVDAAINYLHQRRLRQAKRINAEMGFPGTCDGFLHRERYNSRGVGLLFDLIDPFKFADREFLLIVVLNGGISWRDFKLEHDRR